MLKEFPVLLEIRSGRSLLFVFFPQIAKSSPEGRRGELENSNTGLGMSPLGSLSVCAEHAWARHKGAAGHDTMAGLALSSPE